MTRLPREVRAVWIRRAGTNVDPSEWSRVDVQEISGEPGGEQTVRLKFTGSCPYELFKTVVLAASAGDRVPSGLQPSAAPPSREPAAPPTPAAGRLPGSDSATEVAETGPPAGIENAAVPAHHLRTALASRWMARGEFVGRSRF
jgi:hypothetical protein